MNKLYSVHDHWTDINKKNDVDIESIDGVITGIKVNGEDYGGGGESDFSTAEISISGVSVSQCSVTSPRIITTPFDMIVADTKKYASGDIVTVALYKGKASISASVVGIGSITVSGGIESKGGDYYLITGDCAITIS